jgi:hypothetical protein
MCRPWARSSSEARDSFHSYDYKIHVVNILKGLKTSTTVAAFVQRVGTATMSESHISATISGELQLLHEGL